MMGMVTLSASSYLYHNNIYEKLYNGEWKYYTIPNKENITLFINDTLCIHLRSLFVVITNYYYHPFLTPVLFYSSTLHFISIYHFFINTVELCNDRENHENDFLNIHNTVNAIPIALDVILVSLNSEKEIAIPYMFVNIIIAMIFIVQPFYKLDHVAFHICLLFQNYYMCLSNSK